MEKRSPSVDGPLRSPSRRVLRHAGLLAIALVLAGTALALDGAADIAAATATTKAAACGGVNVRTRASTTGAVRTRLSTGAKVTVVATVTGTKWTVTCAGKTASSTRWYRISAINGRSVRASFGVSYLYAATGLFKSVTAPAPTPATTTRAAACSGVNVRTRASTAGSIRTRLSTGAKVTVVATVTGTKWTVTCAGKTASSTRWYRISAINGRSVRASFGVSYLYAATGLFTAVAAPAVPPASQPAPDGDSTVPRWIEGIDISHWQGEIDWTKVRAGGKQFAFMKASEGTTYVDPTYSMNRAGANAAGVLIGSYHFARPDRTVGDGAAEADHFLDTAQVEPGDLLPVVDIEVAGGLSKVELQDWLRAYLGRIEERTGLRAIVYVSPVFWRTYLDDTDWFATNGWQVLWIAHWTSAATPMLPAGSWAGRGWTFWQYTSDGSVPGISGRVDLDRFAGTDLGDVLVP